MTTSRNLLHYRLAALITAFAATIACGQDPAAEAARPDETAPADSVPDAAVAKLIQELDANQFARRQDASRQLRELGQRAIGPLAEAALGDSREAASRALEILKSHFASKNESLQQAAKAALQKLAQSEKAAIARHAQEVLEPRPAPAAAQGQNPFGAQIQIMLQQGGARNVQMRNVNGVKEIQVQEQGRSTKIQEDPQNGIRVEVTEKVNGQEVTNKYSAKDAAELKRKHPAAHQIYEKYSKNGPQIQIQAPIVIQGIPLAPALPGNRRSVDDKKLADQLEKISAQIEETQKLLEQLKEDPQQTEPLQKAIEQLKAARQAMQKTRRELDG